MKLEHAHEGNRLENITSFRDAFAYINDQKLGGEHENAYDEAVRIGKEFVARKDRSSWNAAHFVAEFGKKYPNVSRTFIEVLAHCIENYNPPVNLASRPLWE